MKRFLTFLFISLALVVSAAGAAPAAHAQDGPDSPGGTTIDSSQPTNQSGNTMTDAEIEALDAQNLAGLEAGDNFTPDTAAASTPNKDKPTTDDEYSGVMQKIMSLFAWLVGVAALTLDYAVYYTVVTMGDYVNHLSAVGVTWQIMRDIGNIIFIFGFLAIGICTILGVGWYGGGTKMLPMLIVGAVFLNFSLFITEAVIDTGNLFATQFYTQIKGGTLPTSASLSGTGVMDAITRDGISNKIMAQLGLQTVYTAGKVNTEVFKAGNSFIIGFMGIILFLVTAFVLFSLAFVLVARFVILLFLIIVAPIGFAGLAIPNLEGLAKMWRDKLVQQTITAPVLLLCLYIALAIITDVSFLTGFGANAGGWTGWVRSYTGTDNLPGFGGLMISFLVAMGLLMAVVIISKQLSAFGADKASQFAGKLTFGATAWGMRNTAGLGMQRLSQKVASSKWARNKPMLGRAAQGLIGVGAKASFDIRGAKVFGGLKGGMGIDAGEAQKGGYRQWEKDAIKGREDYATTLTISKDDEEKIKTEEKLIKTLEENGRIIKEKNDKEMEDLNMKHSTDPALLSANADIDQKRKDLKAAEATRDPKKIRDAQLAFNNSLLDKQQIREKQNKEREDIKKRHDKEISENSEKIKEKQNYIAAVKKAPQLEYAEMLEQMPWGVMYRNSKAAENIRKNAGKSKDQKDAELLVDFIKKGAVGGAGTPTPPPPIPPPAGGGGTPKP